jgi:hypothetical protein
MVIIQSYTWQSIWSTIPLLSLGYRWHIGYGSNINVWTDPWILAQIWGLYKIQQLILRILRCPTSSVQWTTYGTTSSPHLTLTLEMLQIYWIFLYTLEQTMMQSLGKLTTIECIPWNQLIKSAWMLLQRTSP